MTNKKVITPPSSKESEMLVLGSMLTSINALNHSVDLLDEEDFYYVEHQIIFNSMKTLYSRDSPVDLHLLCQELSRIDKLKSVGGAGYLTTLAQYAGTSVFIEEYAKILKDKTTLRKMLFAASKIREDAASDPADVEDLLDKCQQLFFEIGKNVKKDPGISVGEVLDGKKTENGKSFLKTLQERQEKFQNNDQSLTGLATNYIDLDRMIDGLGHSNLIILAARPGMGKTAFAVNIAENVSMQNNSPVAIFSLEMSADQLVERVISSQARVDSKKMKRGDVNPYEFQKIVEIINRIQNVPLYIDDQSGLKISEIRSRARRLKETRDIGLIIIDYLQLIGGSDKKFENRQNEVAEISKMLKIMAKELNIPVLCLSQLSRKVEERQDKKPLMSDLRDSGSIEQDADVVLFLYRPGYYDQYTASDIAECIVSKNRHGETGDIKLQFFSEFTRFENYSPLDFEND